MTVRRGQKTRWGSWMPKLSFIVPVYKPNLGILRKAIKALREQSLKDFEVIFVLDGPDQQAQSIIEVEVNGLKDARVVVQDHAGAQRARNRGAQEAKGEYWVFWDCDCVIEPHAAKAWVDVLDSKPEIGFVYSGYRFLEEQGGIASEPFDPWTLRVRNYISSCFPVRASLFPGWNETLESLQDWDFWLSVVEKGGVGHYLKGYAFATAYPTPESISGKGCTPEAWLERVNKVKHLHALPFRKTCVSSLDHVAEATRLAKLMDADFQRFPSDKPHEYDVLVQVGCNMLDGSLTNVCRVLGDTHAKRRYLFWTADDIVAIYNGLSFAAIKEYRARLNAACTKQFVEDPRAKELMDDVGFRVEVLPMPITNSDETPPMPEKPRWLVDVSRGYGHLMAAVELALPDMDLDISAAYEVKDYTGIIHLHPDKTMTQGVKRAVLTGRHVVSNIEQPFMGYVADKSADEAIPALVNKIRKLSAQGENRKARDFWEKTWGPEKLLEVLK